MYTLLLVPSWWPYPVRLVASHRLFFFFFVIANGTSWSLRHHTKATLGFQPRVTDQARSVSQQVLELGSKD
jgi:hypothetical protein